MGRPKGYKLSDEQKARVQAGKKASIKDIPEKQKIEFKIIGYVKGVDGFVLPVFASEKDQYRKIYPTVEKAKQS
jgi:hypothetical protein